MSGDESVAERFGAGAMKSEEELKSVVAGGAWGLI
jgi:hypothetical protein